jgi:hypothetical protein
MAKAIKRLKKVIEMFDIVSLRLLPLIKLYAKISKFAREFDMTPTNRSVPAASQFAEVDGMTFLQFVQCLESHWRRRSGAESRVQQLPIDFTGNLAAHEPNRLADFVDLRPVQ